MRLKLTMTVVTMAFSSPLCAIVNSKNLFAMLSMNLNLPYPARITTINLRKQYKYKHLQKRTILKNWKSNKISERANKLEKQNTKTVRMKHIIT